MCYVYQMLYLDCSLLHPVFLFLSFLQFSSTNSSVDSIDILWIAYFFPSWLFTPPGNLKIELSHTPSFRRTSIKCMSLVCILQKLRTSVSTQERIAKPIKKFTEKIGYFLSQKSAKKSLIEEEPRLVPDKPSVSSSFCFDTF